VGADHAIGEGARQVLPVVARVEQGKEKQGERDQRAGGIGFRGDRQPVIDGIDRPRSFETDQARGGMGRVEGMYQPQAPISASASVITATFCSA
jgi:hypothetical protein